MATQEVPSSRASSAEIPPKWRRLFDEHLPGYDPAASAAPGEWFDADEADKAEGFFSDYLVFIEGERAGDCFELEDWQKAIVGCLFGWKREDGLRRYRECMIYVPRKNGKTPLCAGLVDYMLFCDDEPGAQLVSAAADREQASHVFRHAAHMVMRNPELDKHVKIYRTYKSIELSADGSVYKALSSEADTKHGSNLNFIIVDELHAHPNRDLVDVLSTGTGSRRQPMMVYITTADYDHESICNEKHDYACKVRDGVFEDSAFLPVIYEASRDDDWTDPEVWRKVNPNLGVSVREEYLERECKKAQDQPTFENTFKRLHLNIKTQQDYRWLQIEKWDACCGDIDPGEWRSRNLEELKGRPCFGGLDLGSNSDLTALALLFPDENEGCEVIPFFWVPERAIDTRERRDNVPYATWVRQGYMMTTPGDATDFNRVEEDIDRLGNEYGIRELAVDRAFQGDQMITNLMGRGYEVVAFGQGWVSMASPMKRLEWMVMKGMIDHGNNPVLRWMAGNMAVQSKGEEQISPSKKHSSDKIDGIVATIMALGRAMVSEPQKEISDEVFFV